MKNELVETIMHYGTTDFKNPFKLKSIIHCYHYSLIYVGNLAIPEGERINYKFRFKKIASRSITDDSVFSTQKSFKRVAKNIIRWKKLEYEI